MLIGLRCKCRPSFGSIHHRIAHEYEIANLTAIGALDRGDCNFVIGHVTDPEGPWISDVVAQMWRCDCLELGEEFA
jgi:hypothetical protein